MKNVVHASFSGYACDLICNRWMAMGQKMDLHADEIHEEEHCDKRHRAVCDRSQLSCRPPSQIERIWAGLSVSSPGPPEVLAGL